MSGGTGNVAASVRQRLLNQARQQQRPFNALLQYYAMERFLYRLSRSVHADRFILKGALMLRVWHPSEVRSTMDIDMLAKTSNELDSIVTQMREIIAVDVDSDGLVFEPDSMRAERITEDADYEGIRIRFMGTLGTARVHMQVDIGFGDIVYPAPLVFDFPTILDSPVPRLLCYSCESSIAEKFEAMLKLGELNSRMKDFYDVWLLSKEFDFDGVKLAEAIRLTLERRDTALPVVINAFTHKFISSKQNQWLAFQKRLGSEPKTVSFEEVIVAIKRFLGPIISALTSRTNPPEKWIAPGPWR